MEPRSDCIYMDAVRLGPNQSENGKYNLISVWFNKILKEFLWCMYRIQSVTKWKPIWWRTNILYWLGHLCLVSLGHLWMYLLRHLRWQHDKTRACIPKSIPIPKSLFLKARVPCSTPSIRKVPVRIRTAEEWVVHYRL